MHEGTCVGGPLDGLTYTVRSEEGFLAVDKEAGLAWIYRIDEQGRWVVCTEDEGALVDTITGTRLLDPERAIRAAEDATMDVIAVPGPPPESEEVGEDGVS